MFTTEVVKRHKRLHVAVYETGAILYTPPDFLRIDSRDRLRSLAQAIEAAQRVRIEDVMAFERDTPCRARQPRNT